MKDKMNKPIRLGDTVVFCGHGKISSKTMPDLLRFGVVVCLADGVVEIEEANGLTNTRAPERVVVLPTAQL